MKIIRITRRKEEADAFNHELETNKDKGNCFILHFYMKGCIHCENLEPKMKNIEKHMAREPKYNNVTLGKIDAEMMNDVNVENAYEFPTLKIIKNGETHQYKGSPEENAILTWINGLVKNKNTNTNKNKNTATKGVHLSNHNSLGRRSLQSNSNKSNASGVTNKNNKKHTRKSRKNKKRKTKKRENNSNKRNKGNTRKNRKNKRSKRNNN
jgi:hypothetical protein